MCSFLLPKLLTDGSYSYPSVLLTSNQLEEDENDSGNMEDDVDNVSKLQESQSYKGIMQKVEDALQKVYDISYQGIVFEDHPEYQHILDCNSLSVEIENEIMIIHNFIRGKYHVKFPELESLVHHPIDYARVVKKIGNEVDLALVDLEGLLPSAVIMVVSVAASTTSDKPLPQEDLNKTLMHVIELLLLILRKRRFLILWKV